MDNDNENSIAQRLKQYMEETGITVSQFADRAGIPRPTFSQLINGRNKTISDQLLFKIYQNFPDLDILWLMFNKPRGNQSEKIETSGPQNVAIETRKQPEQTDIKSDILHETAKSDYSLNNQSIKTSENIAAEPQWAASMMVSPVEETPETDTTDKTDKKEITSIIILYSDNSFDTFKPATKK